MIFLPLATSGCIISLHNFWNAVQIYHDRPQVINRKVIGVGESYLFKVKFHSESVKIKELFSRPSILYETRKVIDLNEESSKILLKNVLESYDKTLLLERIKLQDLLLFTEGLFISVRKLIPKSSSSNCLEIVLFNKDQNTATFLVVEEDTHNITGPPFPYILEWTSAGHVRIVLENLEDAETSSAVWLVDKLFPKIVKWADEFDEEAISEPSLKLISIEEYSSLYKVMKERYGQKMIKVWTENTDPLKFVYEDVAIAAYLICLWKKYSDIKPTFVDLGCGNGLLVYILSEEGYHGYGVDVRKRKIWDIYPKTVNLKILTVTPSARNLFPDVDWIIGNHSDELTPWIPVLASRSSYKANFFLLPCCSYEFSGKKYNRIDTSKSQYNEYLEYVESICKVCGFLIERDKLRIPSTKKIAIVGYGRTYSEQESDKNNKTITEFINKRVGCTGDNQTSGIWTTNFTPRPSTETTRNCTQLDRSLIQKLVKHVSSELLKQEIYLSKNNGDKWNRGGELELGKIVKKIDPADLKNLKRECGGLQTLLRNHRYIFEVFKGSVKVRVPANFTTVQKYKAKPCWFNLNHPNGCLHDENSCAYSHVDISK